VARGNEIVVTSNPRGVFEEGYVKSGQTFYPGMVVLRDTSVALKGGKHTYKIYDESADGDQPTGAFWVVTNGLLSLLGKLCSDSYAAGERVSLYSPVAGEELNLLLKDIAGTADDHAIGEKLVVDTATGKLIATTGSPETEVAQLLEAVTDPAADTLAWCQWSGH
jgi:hypothetical protein